MCAGYCLGWEAVADVVKADAGLAGLSRKDAETEAAKTYALQLADTVLVREGGAPPELLTAACPKAWSEVAYYLKVCPPMVAQEGLKPMECTSDPICGIH